MACDDRVVAGVRWALLNKAAASCGANRCRSLAHCAPSVREATKSTRSDCMSTPPGFQSSSALPYCVPCQRPFNSADPSDFPQSFPCGHVACWSCATAAAVCDPPVCPLCNACTRAGFTPDVALAAFADAYFARVAVPHVVLPHRCEDCQRDGEDVAATHMCTSCGDRLLCQEHGSIHAKRKVPHVVAPMGTPADTSATHCSQHHGHPLGRFCFTDGVVICAECFVGDHAGHDVRFVADSAAVFRSHVAAAAAVCESGSAGAFSAHSALQEARARMVARKAASVLRFDDAVLRIKAAIDAHAKAMKAVAEHELRSRLKAIDAQLDALMVAGNQLSCAAALGTHVTTTCDDALQLAQAFESLRRSTALCRPYRGPCVSTVVEVVCDGASFEATVDQLSRLRLAVDAARSSVSGDGALSFMFDDANIICITARDDTGALIDSLTAEDVCAWIDDGAAHVESVIPEADGVFDVLYSIADADVARVSVGVTVAGCSVAGSPWAIPRHVAGYRGGGTAVRSLRVVSGEKIGMAVSPNGEHVVVSRGASRDSHGNSVVVYDASTGGVVCEFGQSGVVDRRAGRAAQKAVVLRQPGRLCFTPAGNLLVCDHGSACVVECTLTGSMIRTLTGMSAPWAIACSADMIVVGVKGVPGASVFVHDFATGAR